MFSFMVGNTDQLRANLTLYEGDVSLSLEDPGGTFLLCKLAGNGRRALCKRPWRGARGK